MRAALTLEEAEVAVERGLDGDGGGVRGHGSGGVCTGHWLQQGSARFEKGRGP